MILSNDLLSDAGCLHGTGNPDYPYLGAKDRCTLAWLGGGSATLGRNLSFLVLVAVLGVCDPRALHGQTATWTEITQPTSPAFAHHDMTYDSLRHRLIVAGRTAISSKAFALYAGAADGTWSKLTPPTPALPGTADIELAYDSDRDVVVLYTTTTNRVWEFNGTNWTVVTAAFTPVQCADGAQMQYDPIRKKTVLVGCKGSPARPRNFFSVKSFILPNAGSMVTGFLVSC